MRALWVALLGALLVAACSSGSSPAVRPSARANSSPAPLTYVAMGASETAGVGTAQSHDTLSTAPITIAISFHEPVRWPARSWLLYDHESVQVGAGMSYVRGQIYTEEGALLGSFAQEAMIRRFTDAERAIAEAARL